MNVDKSAIDRANILNNAFAVKSVQEQLQLPAISFNNDRWLTVEQVSDFFEVDRSTIVRCIQKHSDELQSNGYLVLTGEALSRFLSSVQFDRCTNASIKTSAKIRRLGLFNLRAFLNLAMLLSESKKAEEIRTLMLNIATNLIVEKTGGNIKYINQRDDRFIKAWFSNEQYNKKLHKALREKVEEKANKYAYFTDLIYKSIFKENAREYRNILELSKRDKTRDTMYAEVLTTISCLENALAAEIINMFKKTRVKLTVQQADDLLSSIVSSPLLEPQIESARQIMASFDHALRNKRHERLEEYISPISQDAYERFLGEKSKELSARINDNLDVFKRLKDQ